MHWITIPIGMMLRRDMCCISIVNCFDGSGPGLRSKLNWKSIFQLFNYCFSEYNCPNGQFIFQVVKNSMLFKRISCSISALMWSYCVPFIVHTPFEKILESETEKYLIRKILLTALLFIGWIVIKYRKIIKSFFMHICLK